MKILLLHQNFPGQFMHLAPALVRRGHQVVALTSEENPRAAPAGVILYKYRKPEPPKLEGAPGRSYAEMSERGVRAARAAAQLRDREGFHPDVVLGHSGWGETLFLREIWPEARHLVYAELMYRSSGLDTDFDAELQAPGLGGRIGTVSRTAHLLQALVQADAAVSPTQWQADSHPPELRGKIRVIHDGVDTARLAPDPGAELEIPGRGLVLRPGDEVLSYVSRSLEPYRGYHVFMRALPAVLAARPEAQVVIVGGEGQSYGAAPPDGRSWKTRFLDEVRDRLDLNRVHFLGRVPYAQFAALMRIARVHAYLTYPFVLSWSLIEALAAGTRVIASRTGPLAEVIEDGVNGRLVDFFDIAGWEQALTRALADPGAGAAMAAEARRRAVAEYDLSVCLPRMIRFVESGGREG